MRGEQRFGHQTSLDQRLDGIWQRRHQPHAFAQLQVVGDEDFIVGDESNDLAWISKERSCLPTDERSVTRMFDKWLDLNI